MPIASGQLGGGVINQLRNESLCAKARLFTVRLDGVTQKPADPNPRYKVIGFVLQRFALVPDVQPPYKRQEFKTNALEKLQPT